MAVKATAISANRTRDPTATNVQITLYGGSLRPEEVRVLTLFEAATCSESLIAQFVEKFLKFPNLPLAYSLAIYVQHIICHLRQPYTKRKIFHF